MASQAIYGVLTWRHESHVGVPKNTKHETAANPVRVELVSYFNTFFFFDHSSFTLPFVSINLHMVARENALQCKEISDWGTLTVFNRSISLGLLSRKKPNSQQDFVSKATIGNHMHGCWEGGCVVNNDSLLPSTKRHRLKQYILFEYILVHSISVVVIQILYSYFQVGAPLTLLNGVVKQVDVRVQRELVHRIYLAHVIQDEEQDRGSLCAWPVTLTTKYEPG